MKLSEVLSSSGFDITKKTRLILTQSTPADSSDRDKSLCQMISIFCPYDFLIVFKETQNKEARYIGSYKRTNMVNPNVPRSLMEYPYQRLCDSYYHMYKFEKMSFSDEKMRQMTIHWGSNKKKSKWLRDDDMEIINLC